MIDRLIPKYPSFLVIGLALVASGLFLLTAARDALVVVWVDKFFDGETAEGLFEAAQTADVAIGHTLTVWLFLGLAFLILGIGFAIATIVQNLRATWQSTRDAYTSTGVAGAEASQYTEPWFGRLFTRFLFAGILVMGLFFLLMLWWDINLVFLKDAEFDGRVSGAAYNTYLMTDRVLGPIISAGRFLSMGMLFFGILTGLATIIWHLSLQARGVPALTQSALRRGNTNGEAESLRPFIPSALLRLGIAGFFVMALATPLALIHSGFIGWELGRRFEGVAAETAVRVAGAFERTIDPLIIMGLSILLFTIAFLLLSIIRWLREFRQGFGDVTSDLSGGAVPRPVVEAPLWPTRLVTPLAIFGIFMVGFFFTMTAVRVLNFNSMLTLQFAGETSSNLFQSALRLDVVLGPIINATRFIGIASLMLAIGLALLTIVINLRATAFLLPTGFSKLITVAQGKEPEAEDLTVYEPMSLAPWDMLRPLLVGAVVVISATLPVAILFGVSIHRMLGEQFAGLGGPAAVSGLFKSSFLGVQLYGASLQPWMLFGMGVILFSIGRFFGTIVGFVQARYVLIAEGTEAISSAVASHNTEESEA